MKKAISRHISIFARIYLFSVVLLFAFMCGVGALLVFVVGPADQADLRRIAGWGAHYLVTQEGAGRRQMLDTLRDEAGVAATIYDSAGAQIDRNTPAHPGALDQAWVERARSESMFEVEYGAGSFLLVHPDSGRGELVALEMLDTKSLVLGGWTLLALLTGLAVIAWPIARSLTVPIRDLQARMAAFGAGDVAVPASPAGFDEIGQLARTFDVMADRIARLVAAERLMIAGVAHELRTPLQRIRVALELATDDAGESLPHRRYIESISSDVADLDQIISDILTVSALELSRAASSQELMRRREWVHVERLMRDCAVRFEAAHPQQRLALQVDAGLPDAYVEPRLIHRAVNNLLENAARYAPAGTAIELNVRSRGPALEIEVRDQGPGIAPEHLPHVFGAFYRADEARARVSGGVGLGLTLVKAIVEAHGGSASVMSEPGRGAIFTLALPAFSQTGIAD